MNEAGDVSPHGMWSSRWLFVLAAVGSAVGLGNIWKFPYLTGVNGGAAFVLIFLATIFVVAVPMLMAEVLIGRQGRNSPVNSLRILVRQHHLGGWWVLVAWFGMFAGVLILSYYSVVAGWALYYMAAMVTGTFGVATASVASETFAEFTGNPWLVGTCHALFLAMTVYIIGKGVVRGLERFNRLFMPLLFLLLLVLLGYGVTSGGFSQAFAFMFDFKWEDVTTSTWLMAMGQSFFTLSLGMGCMMSYGAYVPSDASIPGTTAAIALISTLVSICAGLAIFPIVFANGLEPAQGPGLMFVTLPLAFGQMPFGAAFGFLFFLLASFAAITSAISMTEPALAYLVEEYNAKRSRVAVTLGVLCWLIGIGTVLSFNVLADFTVDGSRTIFAFIDHITQNIMLPIGGLSMAIFCAWRLPRTVVRSQLGIRSDAVWWLWQVLIGVVAPLAVATILVMGLFPCLLTQDCGA
jgi:NSS family neurotransmitter:Na+ symporter